MKHTKKLIHIVIAILSLCFFNSASSNDVEILAAEFYQKGATQWRVNVTLRHKDKGWDHYADNWQIVDSDGHLLGDRVLHHPHVNEQPFTRSLENVNIPVMTKIIYIKAHDKVHGWTKNPLKVDLNKVKESYLKVESSYQ